MKSDPYYPNLEEEACHSEAVVCLQRDLRGAEVGPLVHDVQLQGEGGAIQGVLRPAAVILTHTTAIIRDRKDGPRSFHTVRTKPPTIIALGPCLSPVEVQLQHLVRSLQGSTRHYSHLSLGIQLLEGKEKERYEGEQNCWFERTFIKCKYRPQSAHC